MSITTERRQVTEAIMHAASLFAPKGSNSELLIAAAFAELADQAEADDDRAAQRWEAALQLVAAILTAIGKYQAAKRK